MRGCNSCKVQGCELFGEDGTDCSWYEPKRRNNMNKVKFCPFCGPVENSDLISQSSGIFWCLECGNQFSVIIHDNIDEGTVHLFDRESGENVVIENNTEYIMDQILDWIDAFSDEVDMPSAYCTREGIYSNFMINGVSKATEASILNLVCNKLKL